MNRRMRRAARASVTAVGVAAGLMVLASTTQTPDGFMHAGFDGPLSIFASSAADLQTDVLFIGDGPNDATELAALLNGPTRGNPETPYRVAYEAGSTPNSLGVTALPTDPPQSARITDQALALPVVDAQGRVDCTGAVRCTVDPSTNVTTVTFPSGVVALVQKVNDTTVVAYRVLNGALPSGLQSLLPAPPPAKVPSPAAAAAAPAPAPTPVQPGSPAVTAAAPVAPAIDPGPPAPEPQVPTASSARRGPKVSVTKPPMDFSPGRGGSLNVPDVGNPTRPNIPGLGKVRDALDSVVDAVTGAVDKAIGPGAARTGPSAAETDP